MKQYKAILFDMDGTLLPMDLEVFFQGYMAELSKAMAFTGVPAKQLVGAVWAGTKQMVLNNDGVRTNREVFWEHFCANTGLKTEDVEPATVTFYANEFHNTRSYAGENPLAVEAVRLAHEAAPIVILATNPLFPMEAQQARLSWIGLKAEDFDRVTAYADAHYSKPNPKYFLEICERHGISPEECLMVGNDEKEDMQTATSIGMDGYLVTDWVIRREECPWNGLQGSFQELLAFLKALKQA